MPMDEHEVDPRMLAPGTVLAGRYEIVDCIGRGGMATVYRARQLSLGRDVALKVLHRRSSDIGLARFSAEASLTAKIRHANVVDVLDQAKAPMGSGESVPFIVMELLEGEDLHARLRREGPLPWPVVRALILQICAGLHAAHAVGVVHRDLKPANCFCVDEPEGTRIKLLDFGVAKPVEARGEPLTVEARVLGTPEYMSPEQAQAEPVDARSDVYAVGVILGELLTGRVPFAGKSAHAIIGAHIYQTPPRLADLAGGEVRVHPAIEAIYARALSKDPDDRFASIDAMAEAVAAVDEMPAVVSLARSAPATPLGRLWDFSRSLVAGIAAYLLLG